MKEKLLFLIIVSVSAGGCWSHDRDLAATVDSLRVRYWDLQAQLASRDSSFEEVISAVNEVYAGIELARIAEGKVVKRAGGTEGPVLRSGTVTRQSLLSDISDIDSLLNDNRGRIAGLEVKVSALRGQVSGLKKMVTNLKKALEIREEAIAALERRVQGLQINLAVERKAVEQKDDMIDLQRKMMNTVFYVVGTRSELKEKGVIRDEGGFPFGLIGSTSTLASGVDLSLFGHFDKTRRSSIPVGGTVEEILPHRDSDLFALSPSGGNETSLKILRPDKFWQDRYLVIVTD
jgi:hypothetical protein